MVRKVPIGEGAGAEQNRLECPQWGQTISPRSIQITRPRMAMGMTVLPLRTAINERGVWQCKQCNQVSEFDGTAMHQY
jgi:hypothetical protein